MESRLNEILELNNSFDIRSECSEGIFLHCVCGGETIWFYYDPSLGMWSLNFDAPQKLSLWDRIKFAWDYIRKRIWYDIELSNTQILRLEEFIKSYRENSINEYMNKEIKKKLLESD